MILGWALIFFGGFCLALFGFAVVTGRAGREEVKEVAWPLVAAVAALVVGLNLAFPETSFAKFVASYGFSEDLLLKLVAGVLGLLFASPGIVACLLFLYLPYRFVTVTRRDGFNPYLLAGALVGLVGIPVGAVPMMSLGFHVGTFPFRPPEPGSPAAKAIEAKDRISANAGDSRSVSLNTSSKKFHEPGCRYYDCAHCVTVPINEAQAQQGTPCRHCH